MSPRFILRRENVLCVAEVVNRSLKADCTDFTYTFPLRSHLWKGGQLFTAFIFPDFSLTSPWPQIVFPDFLISPFLNLRSGRTFILRRLAKILWLFPDYFSLFHFSWLFLISRTVCEIHTVWNLSVSSGLYFHSLRYLLAFFQELFQEGGNLLLCKFLLLG